MRKSYSIEYGFKKRFDSVPLAIEETCKLSESLGQSDLYLFGGCETAEELAKATTEAVTQHQTDAYVFCNQTENMTFFSYKTLSEKNSLKINLPAGKEGHCYAYYRVCSRRSLRDSGIAGKMLAGGWELFEGNIDPKTQRHLEMEEDDERVRRLLYNLQKKQLHLTFRVEFAKGADDIPYIGSQVIETDPSEDLKRLQLRPDLAKNIREIAEQELRRKFKFPIAFEYNEELRTDTSWYEKKFSEYQGGLKALARACEDYEHWAEMEAELDDMADSESV